MYKITKIDKSPAVSKINWTGFIIVILGYLVDPKTYSTVNDVTANLGFSIPQWLIAELIRWAGFAVIVFRTFLTKVQQQQPGPDSPPDVYVEKVDNTPFAGTQV